MEIQIDFGGFYHYHDEYIDDKCDMYGIDTDNVDWGKTFVQYSVAWLHRFTDKTGIELFFDGLDSPRYYNYTTDKIKANVISDVSNQFQVRSIFEQYRAKWHSADSGCFSGFV